MKQHCQRVIAMTSIRMEPVWLTLGHSAGIAAAHALKENVAVQAIDFPRYREALLAVGQVLELTESQQGEWTSPAEWDQAKLRMDVPRHRQRPRRQSLRCRIQGVSGFQTEER